MVSAVSLKVGIGRSNPFQGESFTVKVLYADLKHINNKSECLKVTEAIMVTINDTFKSSLEQVQ